MLDAWVSLYEGTKHALGTAMKAAGVDDRVIADLFGHSDARSVLPYSKGSGQRGAERAG